MRARNDMPVVDGETGAGNTAVRTVGYSGWPRPLFQPTARCHAGAANQRRRSSGKECAMAQLVRANTSEGTPVLFEVDDGSGVGRNGSAGARRQRDRRSGHAVGHRPGIGAAAVAVLN